MSQIEPLTGVASRSIFSLDGITPFTPHEHWRLRFGSNTQKEWVYLHSDKEREAWPQANLEKFILGLPMTGGEPKKATTPLEAAINGFDFMKKVQAPDGHWPGVCGAQMYLIPMYVITLYLCGTKVLPEEGIEMVRFMLNHADPVDGGWGLHGEHPTTVFGLSVNYIALRMLGVRPDHVAMIKARNTLRCHGGAVGCPAWGKFWLSLINLYDWGGNNPIPPEILLFPDWSPVHPNKWWIFMRAFYIPMSYLYRVRYQAPENDLILALREELYVQPYDSIHWPSQRNQIAEPDYLVPHTTFLDSLYMILDFTLESCQFPPLTRRALNATYEQIVMEDENTDYFDLISVSNFLQTICRLHAEGPESAAVQRHLATIKEFIWMGPDGMQVTATNGCQVWDIALISHALVESGLSELPDNQESVRRLLGFLDREQMTENTMHYPKDYRQPTKGGWPFSTRRQNGYVVSDCTGEALKAVLMLQPCLQEDDCIPDRRLFDAVDLLISMQASDGGLPSYECERGGRFLEMFNPAELYE
ncbi:hypothetical protein EW146_g10277 [Bondarzewia mesenterica]|uniref:Squalene cyclase N-terminal domain-containing protein n=1 Tax=Bondarzewia mesenterica TaxID=1095465 RepID=A0A4S4KYR2_9AGAM|nr:hypothetical protein EW146_g10277 [Bondarzewia mesenterica]